MIEPKMDANDEDKSLKAERIIFSGLREGDAARLEQSLYYLGDIMLQDDSPHGYTVFFWPANDTERLSVEVKIAEEL